MFGAPDEWTPDTREGWKNTWMRKKFQLCFHILTLYLSLELVIAGLRSGHDVWVKFNQNSVLSTSSTRSHVWKEFNPRRVINITEVWTVHPHLIFFIALRNPPYPWFAQGGLWQRCHSPSTKSILLVWIRFFYTVTDGQRFGPISFLTRFFLAQLPQPQPSPWDANDGKDEKAFVNT